ncbi:Leucine Rich Repeat family protein [Histomonas meleagridis]|uniref:Leucine Rich Repeat family protein n=1 Tax=Histomonas meleagridis TaxID=135588 RepID=UPI00355ACA45|nr:Leucine Rich Repeat family protein [Histomonas meleagridis]KAH0799557.1 Leucine Rich Repeat family protein [Histomonas meleagridis]
MAVVNYAYKKDIKGWDSDKTVRSLDLLSTPIEKVNISGWDNLRRIRISQCHRIKTITIKNMPHLEAADFLYDSSLQKVEFKNCPKLKALEISFNTSLTSVTGVDSLLFLSAYKTPLQNLPKMPNLLFIDIGPTNFKLAQILELSKNLEVVKIQSANTDDLIKMSQVTSHPSLRVLEPYAVKLELDSVSPNTKLEYLSLINSIELNTPNRGILKNIYTIMKSGLTNDYEFTKPFEPFQYVAAQHLLYGPWGVPSVDLKPPVQVEPIIHPPANVDKLQAAEFILGSIFCSAAFDMIGVGVEFLSKSKAGMYLHKPFDITWSHPRMSPHTFRFLKGTPTDDTSQMVLIMRSIVDNNSQRPEINNVSTFDVNGVCINVADFAYKLVDWAYHGHPEHNHPGGLGLGHSTHLVISQSDFKTDPIKAANTVWESSEKKMAPNGSVMRIASSGAFAFWDETVVKAVAEKYGKATHADPRCVFCTVAAALLIARYIQKNTGLRDEVDIDQTIQEALEYANVDQQYMEDINRYTQAKTLDEIELDEFDKIGYCLKAFGSAVWALKYCRSIEDALVAIIPEAGDSDTNGAVVGAILGAKYGFKTIPWNCIKYMYTGQWLWREVIPYLKLIDIECPEPYHWNI